MFGGGWGVEGVGQGTKNHLCMEMIWAEHKSENIETQANT